MIIHHVVDVYWLGIHRFLQGHNFCGTILPCKYFEIKSEKRAPAETLLPTYYSSSIYEGGGQAGGSSMDPYHNVFAVYYSAWVQCYFAYLCQS